MTIVSTLEIMLRADMARLQQDMDRARQTVGNAMDRISTSVGNAMNMIKGFAAALSVGAFVSFVKNNIDAADALNDMSARTKVAIEDLAGLAYAAKLGDTSLEGVAGSISKLGMNIGKDGAKFRELGVTATDPLEAFKQLSDIFKNIKDPQQRAAFGAEALGKSWQEAAVLLDGGSQGIDDLVKRGKELSGITEQVAADAGKFNDGLDTMGFVVEGVGTRIAAGLLPMLNLLVDDMTATGEGADAVADKFTPLNEALRALIIFGGNVAYVLKGVGTEIGVWAAQIGQYYSAVYQFLTLDFKGGIQTLKGAFGTGGIGDMAAIDAEKGRAAFDAWEKKWIEVGTASQASAAEVKDAGDLIADSLIAAATAAKVANFLGASDIAAARKKAATDSDAAAKKEQAAYAGLIASIKEKMVADQAELDGGLALTAAQQIRVKLDAELKAGKISLTDAHIVEVKALLDNADALSKNAAAANQVRAASAALADERGSSYAAAINEAVANEQLVANFGLTKAAIEANELAGMKARLAQRTSLELGEDEIAQMERMIAVKSRNVAATARLTELQDAQKSADSLKSFLDTDKAQSFGDALRDAFNGAGSSIVRMANALRDFGKVSNETETRRGEAANQYMKGLSTEAKYTKDLIEIDKKQASDKLGSYGDMAGAAASFFDKQSGGYKLLTGVSEAFHLAQLAMNLASIGPAIAAGAAQMFAQSGWGGFAGVAAMIGVMAALGAATSGGGGGPSAKQRQEAQGTGSILGDSSAKSDSIARSIELAATNSSIELTHTAGMLASLKAIENSIGGLGNLLVRGSGLTGEVKAGSKSSAENLVNNTTFQLAFGGVLGVALNKLDQALGGWGGKLASSVFGGKVTALDTGLTTKAASLGSIATNGVVAQQYTDIKKSGGWFSSDKYSTSTSNLGAEANDQFAKVILSLSASVKTAAELLGVGGDAFTAKLNSFVVDIGKISLKDLKGEEIQEALEAVFSKLGDDMAQFGVAGLEQFQKVGEGYFETLTRVATNYANLNSIMESIGTTFGTTGMSSIAARERLIELAGGIDELASQTSSFATNFLSQAEQLAPVQKYVTDQLAAMGLQSLDTRDKFKDYTLGLASSGALATEAGAAQYTALLALAEAFAKTHAATVDLTKTEQAIADERTDLQTRLNEATMTMAQIAELTRSKIDPLNLSLYDTTIAAEAAKSAADALATANANYQQQIDQLLAARQGESAVRALEIVGMDATTIALRDRVAALKAEDKALADAKAAALSLGKTLLDAVDIAFSNLTAAVNDQKKLLESAHKTAMDAMQVQIDKTSASVAKLAALSDALHSTLNSIRDQSITGPEDRASALAQVATALALARASGAMPDVDSLKGALATLSKDSSDQFASYLDYQRANYEAANVIGGLADLTDDQLSVEQRMLDSLKSQKDLLQQAYEAEVLRLDGILETAKEQVDVLHGINAGVASIPAALIKLAESIAAVKANPIASAPASIAGAYQQYLGRDPEVGAIDWWSNQAANGVDVVKGIANSNEAKIQDLYKSLLGRSGEAAGVDFWEAALAAGQSLDQIKAGFQASAEYKGLHPFAVGTNYVPRDMPAYIHEGEAIIPAADNRELMARLSSPAGNSDAAAAEIRELRRENAEWRAMQEASLYSIAKYALSTADSLEGAINGETPFATKQAKIEEAA